MGDNLMKAIVLIGDKVVGKAIAIRTCIRSEETGVWGFAQRKFVRPRPLERQETPIYKVGYKLFSSLIFVLRKES